MDAGSSVPFSVNNEASNAASVIQKAWKRWQDMAVFDYYKGLIGFKQRGKPSSLMRYIEPREAEYLDAAAGIHIRFRLGGLKFPPSIYYKIFTHRPIVDLCAYSPKDYAKLALKTREERKRQGKNDKDHSNWYKRIENNGWRLLSLRFWKVMDSITSEDNNKTKEFQYSKLMRKQEIEKRRKRKKIEWLKKIYIKEWRQIGTSKVSEGYRGFQFSERSHDLSQLPQKLQEIVHSRMT
ncbi:protein MFI isoform X2 [Anolis carolinensis]|uniref:protein MFI isoform X2 n=1 Tax=Anolis carolinensis TaxID=28377 RepID=UPI002F2B592D